MFQDLRSTFQQPKFNSNDYKHISMTETDKREWVLGSSTSVNGLSSSSFMEIIYQGIKVGTHPWVVEAASHINTQSPDPTMYSKRHSHYQNNGVSYTPRETMPLVAEFALDLHDIYIRRCQFSRNKPFLQDSGLTFDIKRDNYMYSVKGPTVEFQIWMISLSYGFSFHA